jgi:hypothetical protein
MLFRAIVITLVILFLAAFAFVLLITPGFDPGVYFANLGANDSAKGGLLRGLFILSAFGYVAFKSWTQRRRVSKPVPKKKPDADLGGF